MHPDDDNGDVLRRLESRGDDLTRSREIDFSIVFRSEFAASEFAEAFRHAGYGVVIRLSNVREERPWDVTVTKYMVPTHASITAFEGELQEEANALDGVNDGWGCFSQPSKHLQ